MIGHAGTHLIEEGIVDFPTDSPKRRHGTFEVVVAHNGLESGWEKP